MDFWIKKLWVITFSFYILSFLRRIWRCTAWGLFLLHFNIPFFLAFRLRFFWAFPCLFYYFFRRWRFSRIDLLGLRWLLRFRRFFCWLDCPRLIILFLLFRWRMLSFSQKRFLRLRLNRLIRLTRAWLSCLGGSWQSGFNRTLFLHARLERFNDFLLRSNRRFRFRMLVLFIATGLSDL